MGSFFNSIIRESRGEMPTATTQTFDSVTDPVAEHNPSAVEHYAGPETNRPLVPHTTKTNKSFLESTNEAQAVTRHRNSSDVPPLVQDTLTQDVSHGQRTMSVQSDSAKGPLIDDIVDSNRGVQVNESDSVDHGNRRDDSTAVLQSDQPDDLDERVQLQADVTDSNTQAPVQPNTEYQMDNAGFVQRAVLSVQYENSVIAETEQSVPVAQRDVNIPKVDQTGSFTIQEKGDSDVQSQANQSGDVPIDLNALAQEKNADESQSFVVKHETHVENNIFRPVTEKPTTHAPQVKIGLVNVIVETPKQTQSVSSGIQQDDQTSRNYLRSL